MKKKKMSDRILTTEIQLEKRVYFNRTKKILQHVYNVDGLFIIPDTVVRVGEFAFDCSSNITEIKIPDSVRFLGVGCFQGLEVTTLELPHSIINIPDLCFFGCHQLKTVVLPDSLTKIGGLAFGECFNLEHVNIPASVTHIEPDAFGFCDKVQFTVDPANPNYMSVDGKLCTKEGKQVLHNLSYEVPEE